MNTERNKYLTEAMGGKIESGCMLDVSSTEDATLCVIDDPLYGVNDCCFSEAGRTKKNCGEWKTFIVGGIPDFSTWDGFGKLWEWAQKQEWWNQFSWVAGNGTGKARYTHLFFHADDIHPDRFANAVYEFLKGRES